MIRKTFFTEDGISSEHSQYKIRGITIWFITHDAEVITIKGKSRDYEHPSEDPKEDAKRIKVIKSEMYEITGIRMNKAEERPQFSGYYLVENDPKFDEPYLYVRYYVTTQAKSSDLKAEMNKRK